MSRLIYVRGPVYQLILAFAGILMLLYVFEVIKKHFIETPQARTDMVKGKFDTFQVIDQSF